MTTIQDFVKAMIASVDAWAAAIQAGCCHDSFQEGYIGLIEVGPHRLGLFGCTGLLGFLGFPLGQDRRLDREHRVHSEPINPVCPSPITALNAYRIYHQGRVLQPKRTVCAEDVPCAEWRNRPERKLTTRQLVEEQLSGNPKLLAKELRRLR